MLSMFIEVNLLKHKASDTVSGPSEAALAATVTSRLFRWRISRQWPKRREADRSQKSFLEEQKLRGTAQQRTWLRLW